MSVLSDLGGPRQTAAPVAVPGLRGWTILPADEHARTAHDALRTEVFVHRQGLFERHDRDDVDDDPRTIVLVALTPDGDRRLLLDDASPQSLARFRRAMADGAVTTELMMATSLPSLTFMVGRSAI